MTSKINRASEKAQSIINAYRASNAYALWDVYDKCSSEKRNAFKRCINTMGALNGESLKIISASKYHFTVAFMSANSDGTCSLMCITKNNTYAIALNECDFAKGGYFYGYHRPTLR